jgi:hypothetical protein
LKVAAEIVVAGADSLPGEEEMKLGPKERAKA